MGRKAEIGAGAIYALHRGELKQLFTRLTIPNAICFSPDAATGYFADTRENVLYRVPLDPATGLPSGEPPRSTGMRASANSTAPSPMRTA